MDDDLLPAEMEYMSRCLRLNLTDVAAEEMLKFIRKQLITKDRSYKTIRNKVLAKSIRSFHYSKCSACGTSAPKVSGKFICESCKKPVSKFNNGEYVAFDLVQQIRRISSQITPACGKAPEFCLEFIDACDGVPLSSSAPCTL